MPQLLFLDDWCAVKIATIIFTTFAILNMNIAQIVDEPRLQPWPIKINAVGTCCEHIFSPELTLLDCINNSVDSNLPKSQVSLMTYMQPGEGLFGIKDILEFGKFQAGVMAAYAEHNGYSFHIMSSLNDTAMEAEDPRWIKVKLLSNALDVTSGWARDTNYIVWIGREFKTIHLQLLI